jgi:acetyl esterase/lipase
MKTTHILLLAHLAVLCAVAAEPARKRAASPDKSYPPAIDGAKVETYKQVNGTDLKVWLFYPPVAQSAASQMQDKTGLPAIVFFFGGGWQSGSPTQFEPQSRHLASRGMIAIVADYRVASRQHVKPCECVADAKSCVRWLRKNAARLGIDPHRLAAGGGSAGGHLAAAVATLPGLDEPGEDASVSCVPDALVLFNPGLMMAPFGSVEMKGFGANLTPERFGCAPEAISPIHHVRKGLPPTLILHGRADTTVPYVTAEAFCAEMTKAGNRCELAGYDGMPHGFFNKTKYDETLAETDRFLTSLGYLPKKVLPNILFILTEDNSTQLSFNNTPGIQTPHVDALVGEGLEALRASGQAANTLVGYLGDRTYAETVRVKDQYPEAYRVLQGLDPQNLNGKVPSVELYDLKADPDELRDCAVDPACATARKRLMTALRQ